MGCHQLLDNNHFIFCFCLKTTCSHEIRNQQKKNNQRKIWRKINRLIDLIYAIDDENKWNKEVPVHVKKNPQNPTINMTENSAENGCKVWPSQQCPLVLILNIIYHRSAWRSNICGFIKSSCPVFLKIKNKTNLSKEFST